MADQTAVPTYAELMDRANRAEGKIVRLISEAERTEERLADERDRARARVTELEAQLNSIRQHWSETADRVFDDTPFLLGEGEDGRWYVRRYWRDVYRRVEWWNPLHWAAYLGTRITHRMIWLERGDNV